jgi:nucleotide-binding universal stress UspA family protein
MDAYQRIVVAVDGSPHSDRAVSHARTLAGRFGAQLFLVHAFAPLSELVGYERYERVVSRRTLAGQAVLDHARKELGAIPAEVELLEGPPADAILRVAEQRDADLIVMGTRGVSDLAGLLVGSVSHKVMHSAHCPVLVVR